MTPHALPGGTRSRFAAAFLVALFAAACGETAADTTTTVPPPTTTTTVPATTTTTVAPTTTTIPEECPAASLAGDVVAQPDLPPPVASMRQAIIEAALRCDVEQLVDLALEGDPDFIYSFGGSSPPPRRELLAAWQNEGFLDAVLLVRILNLPWASRTGADQEDPIYVWPSAFGDNPTEEDWAALEAVGLVTPEGRAEMEELFGGWVGERVGITADGDWTFLVAGD